mgnify:CR=1 FL=1
MERKIQEILAKFKGKQKALNYYLAGFADGEGSFSVSIIRTDMTVTGWAVNPGFHVYQHEQHREILELFQFVFKTGKIYRKSGTHPVLNYSVSTLQSITEKVIPFFDKYPLVVKEETYKKFRFIIAMMERKEHLTVQGFMKIVNIAYTMNQQGKGRKYSKEYILSTLPKL